MRETPCEESEESAGSPLEPGIVIPRDWRSAVAGWPHWRWVAWRQRAWKLQPPNATAEEITAADLAAYEQMADPWVIQAVNWRPTR